MKAHDREACPGCGIHPSVVDELGSLTFEDRLCKVCRGQTQYGRHLAAQDRDWNKAHPDAEPHQARPGDGRYSVMRQATPEEIAEREDERKHR